MSATTGALPPLLPPPRPNPASTLPPEIILQILERVEDVPPGNSTSFYLNSEKITFLSSSLVCRDWVEPSQRTLWKRLLLLEEEEAQLVLESPMFGVYPTKSLWISGPMFNRWGVKMESALRIVDGLKGIGRLKLYSFRESMLDVLMLKNLEELVSLKLYEVSLGNEAPPVSFPFKLKALQYQKQPLCHPRTLSNFYSPSLTTLSLDFTPKTGSKARPDTSIHDLSLLVRSCSLYLQELSIHSPPTPAPIRSLFPDFTSLQVLHLSSVGEDLTAMLLPIPSQLEAFHLYHVTEPNLGFISELLDIPSLAKLRLLGIHHYGLDVDDYVPQLTKKLKERGIVLSARNM